jgi:MinD superfamily P-loop ATPase
MILTRNITEVFNKKPIDTPVVAVTGGKGGTGKTSIAVNLATSLGMKGYRLLLVDTDVDSPTTAIALGIQPRLVQEVKTFIPRIVEARCDRCGRCIEVCRAHALIQIGGNYPMFFEELCSGCEACLLACPSKAIENGMKIIGHLYRASLGNISLIGGELKPGEARSAQIVAATRDLAFREASRENYDLMIIDTPPGTHCNVVQSLKGADLALAVTEPTPLGIYDLDLILKLTKILGIFTRVILNKADLPGHDKEAMLVAKRYGSEVISEIPLDVELFQSYVAGKPLVLAKPDSPGATAIKMLAELVLGQIKIRK